jgi:hypothetical protein
LQHLLLPLGRQISEVLQPLLELLLTGTWEASKVGIVFKGAPLLVQRLLPGLIEPLAGMVTLRRRLVWPGNIVAWALLCLRIASR